MARTKRRTHGEGTVYQKRPDYWCAQIRYEGRRVTASGPTADAARRALADKLQTPADGTDAHPVVASTVGEYLTTWIADLRATESLKPSTWRRYESISRIYLVPVLGQRPLTDLTKQDVAGLIQTARSGGVPNRDRSSSDGVTSGFGPTETTLHHIHAVLRVALEHALDQGLVDRNVARLIRGPSMRHRPKTILGAQQALALVEAAHGEPFGAAIVLGVAIGMREGEILGLRRSDLKLDTNTLFVSSNAQIGYSGARELVEPKTEAGKRSILLPRFAVDALRDHLSRQSPASELVFPATSGHLLAEWRFLRQHFYPTLAKAGLPQMRFHDLRHSAATLLKEMGVDDVTISQILGHSSPVITMKLYGHVTPMLARRAADRMDGILGPTARVTREARRAATNPNGSQMAAKAGPAGAV